MKTLILMGVIAFYSLSSFALQENDININAGVGIFGTRGILGISADKFFTQNHVLSIAVGLDFIGATSAVGYKYFSEKINSSNSIWDKCFFMFECDRHLYLGSSLQYAGGATAKITEGANVRDYKIDPKWLGLVSLGSRAIMKNNVTLDVEISYRSIFTGGQAVQTAGGLADDTKLLEMGYRSVGINFGIGYLF